MAIREKSGLGRSQYGVVGCTDYIEACIAKTKLPMRFFAKAFGGGAGMVAVEGWVDVGAYTREALRILMLQKLD
jgi:hypothetical protein